MFDWMIFSQGRVTLIVGWFLHFKFSSTLPVVGHCFCSEMNEKGPIIFRPERTESEENILIEKAIRKWAIEIFREWQSNRAVREG